MRAVSPERKFVSGDISPAAREPISEIPESSGECGTGECGTGECGTGEMFSVTVCILRCFVTKNFDWDHLFGLRF